MATTTHGEREQIRQFGHVAFHGSASCSRQGEATRFPNIPGTCRHASYADQHERTERAVEPPQCVDDFSFSKGSHQFAMGLNFRFYQHNDRRGQPGGINVTPSISFSATVRPPAGFNTPTLSSSTAAGINATDNTRLLGTINDVMGIPARLSQVFGDISADAIAFPKAASVATRWATGSSNTTSTARMNGVFVRICR